MGSAFLCHCFCYCFSDNAELLQLLNNFVTKLFIFVCIYHFSFVDSQSFKKLYFMESNVYSWAHFWADKNIFGPC